MVVMMVDIFVLLLMLVRIPLVFPQVKKKNTNYLNHLKNDGIQKPILQCILTDKNLNKNKKYDKLHIT